MHILFLDSSAQLGGAERVLLDLIAGLRVERSDWRLTLCAPADGPLVDRANRLGAEATVVPFPSALGATGDYGLRFFAAASAVPDALAYAMRLRTRLRSLDPDVIHSNGLKMHVVSAWTKPTRARLVWHLHDYVSRRARSAALLRRSAGACSAIVANSQSVADDASRTLRTACEPRAILNGVDLDIFSPQGPAADLDGLAGMRPAPEGTVRVGLVATYARWKGHHTFIQAIASLSAESSVRAYIVGAPIYQTAGSQHTRQELEAEAARLGVLDRVGFVDFVDEPASVYRGLDVVVHASTEPEPFGLVVAEAMACGRAVVSSDTGGVTEIVEPGADGLVHHAGDIAGLAAGIARLATDEALRRSLGAAARRTALLKLDGRRVVHEFCRLYVDEPTAPARRHGEAVGV